MGKKTKKIAITITIIGVLIGGILFFQDNTTKKLQICISNHCIDVEIADTVAKQRQGLMNVKHLPENSGMFFVFGKEDHYTFWMKKTLIPLDILRIDNQNTIVEIQTAQPCKTDVCETYGGKELASYVLEINANLSEKRNITTGQKVSIHY